MKKILFVIILFAFTSLNAQYTPLHSFNSGGFTHTLNGLYFDGTYLYGTNKQGGTNNNGTIFKIKPDGTGFTTIFNFDTQNHDSPIGRLVSDGIYLYGMATDFNSGGNGFIYKIKPDGSGFLDIFDFSIVNDGAQPSPSLFFDGTYLYGATDLGGLYGDGIIFRIKPDGTSYTTLKDLDESVTGLGVNNLISDGTYLYGTIQFGGLNSYGTFFRMKLDGTSFTILLNFDKFTNGSYPSGLISYGGFLYGTTVGGGTNNKGTIFKIMSDGSGYQKIFDFNGINGCWPSASSLLLVGSNFYGTTSAGGPDDHGTVFKIQNNGTGFVNVFNFLNSTNAYIPFGQIVSDGISIYGLTAENFDSNNSTYGEGDLYKLGLTTGINEDLFKLNRVLVYPNPCDGLLNISYVNTLKEIEVFDNLGSLVFITKIDDNDQINLSSLSKGMYFLRIFTGEQYHMEKVIVK
ncbi:MAG TPA: T9SS type A sorting domain-containing protein [Bacteroidia bacterium]|nr:T9SS type A sorting domain-containing protein [Bacteroidia bacterium]